MAYNRLPLNLPKLLKHHGLKVVTVPGWKTRGRPASTGGFSPVGVLCHHTATSKSASDAAVLRLLVDGRPDLPGPLCHLGLGRDGTVYVVASGRANHAGQAKSSGTVASGDGNSLYIGIEAFNDGVGEPWGREQYEAYVRLCAVLSLKVTGNSANSVRGHKETSVTGKPDPKFDMDDFRNKVAVEMGKLSESKTTDTDASRGRLVDHALKDLMAAKGKGRRAKQIKAAIAALKLIKPAADNH